MAFDWISFITGVSSGGSSGGGSGEGGVSVHNELSGRSTSNAHPLTAIAGLESALANKQELLDSGVNIATVNNQSLLDGGNINIDGGVSASEVNATVSSHNTNTTAHSNQFNLIKLDLDALNADKHSHTNKTALDAITSTTISNITSDISDLDSAKHTHANKAVLDTITAQTFANIQNDISNLETDVENLETGKQDTLVNGVNIKTINGINVLGSGNINIEGGSGGGSYTLPTASTTVKGGVRIGSNFVMDDEILNIDTTQIALKSDIPTSTSQLTNNSNFVVDANYVHTDNNYSNEEKAKLEGKQNSLTVEQLANIADIPNKADSSEIPTKLPNPNVLTFTGAVNETYDGSSAKTINIPTGGGSGETNAFAQDYPIGVEKVVSVEHNLNTENVVISLYDQDGNEIIATEITIVDTNNISVDTTSLDLTSLKVVILAVGGSQSISGGNYIAGDHISIENNTISVDLSGGLELTAQYLASDFAVGAIEDGNKSIGTEIKISSPIVSSAWSHLIIEATKNTVMTIEGIGGNTPRLWALLSKDTNILLAMSDAALNTVGNPVTIDIPYDCNVLIQSNLSTEPTSNVKVYEVKNRILTDQDILQAGDGVKIEGNVISATGTGGAVQQPMVIGSPMLYISETYAKDSLNAKQTSDIYAIYDDLVTRFPQYVKREPDLGESVNGETIRAYSIRFQNPIYSEGNFSHTLPTSEWTDERFGYNKAIITCGIHGDEKASHWGTALLLQEMLEKQSENWANFILGNLIIEVAPMVNPDGFNTTTRENVNDIDLNRDFVDFSQPETLAIKAFIDRHPDAVAHIDIHNGTGFHQFGIATSLDSYYVENMKGWAKLAGALSSNWKQTYDEASSTSDYPYLYLLQSYTDLNTTAYSVKTGTRAFVVEGARDFIGGTSINYLASCKFTKDQLANLLMSIAHFPQK